MQNKAPKVTEADLSPANWDADHGHEWCPPGHGDLYLTMLGSGTLDKLLKQDFRYMFVSNSDNLGATMDVKLALALALCVPRHLAFATWQAVVSQST